MRLRTVKKRLRSSGLPTFYVQKVFEAMKGYADNLTELDAEHYEKWLKETNSVFEQYRLKLDEEIQSFKRSVD